ncbi:hypothetical protein [Caulobacter sp. S45]|uniref:hypothetical protein n=1 Tax=Caulobacter sp. S45 TaxID=1641861 RepID=UPI001575149D|nr:hypothetical protein [Caulobacter sp. S45]
MTKILASFFSSTNLRHAEEPEGRFEARTTADTIVRHYREGLVDPRIHPARMGVRGHWRGIPGPA